MLFAKFTIMEIASCQCDRHFVV